MATKSYQTQLEEVQAAITAVLSGQTYSISTGEGATWSVSQSNLSELREYEKELRAQVARETRGGIRIFGGTPV